jgi:6-phosphogluconolactonase
MSFLKFFIPSAMIASVGLMVASFVAVPEKTVISEIKKRSVPEKPLLLLVGTYTKQSTSKGLYVYEMNPKTGGLSFVSSCESVNPSYLTIHSNKQWVYAVNETGGDTPESSGAISAFKFDPVKKQLSLINSVSSKGKDPCYVSIDNSGKFAMLANYSSGNVAVYPIKSDGSLGEISSTHQHLGKGENPRQNGPHAHMIIPGQANFIYSNDLGTDKTLLYTLDSKGILTLKKEMETKPGAGPRHLTFHSNQKWVYVVNELNGTIEASALNKNTGEFTRFQIVSTLPEGQTVFAGCADIHISPSGKYLYASNRGEVNSIAMYTINQTTGELKLIGHQSVLGKSPRNFVIDPTGTFLLVANQNSNNVVTFRIDASTGKLIDTGIQSEIPMPVCLKFLY